MGVSDRVKGFLDSWPLIRKNLDELMGTVATVAIPEYEEVVNEE